MPPKRVVLERSTWMFGVVLGILTFWFQMLLWLPNHWGRPIDGSDLWIYYKAATRFHAHLPVYPLLPPTYGPHSSPDTYFYPPFLAAVLSPLSGHPSLYNHLWYVFILSGFWAFAFLLARLSAVDSAQYGVMFIWAFVLMFAPGIYCHPPLGVWWIMSLGNIEPIMWALFAGAVLSMGDSRRLWLAQSLLAVMVMFKPYALLAWVVVALRSPARSRFPAAGIMAMALSLTIVFGGIRPFVDWVLLALPAAAQGTLAPINFSLPYAVLRLLHGLNWWHYPAGALPAVPRLFLSLCSVSGPCLVAWAMRKGPMRTQVVGAYLAAVLCSPICWYTYLTVGYVPIAIMIGRRKRREIEVEEKADDRSRACRVECALR